MSAAALQDVQSAPLALIGSARAGRRTLLDMLLSAKGYEIATCEDGPAVLEFLKENQPAIAIFDHDLPGMDGREICSRMRFITRLADTPIAIVTPQIEEMGGAADFESFTDTTTADIVEAEPLGKKKLIERLENVSRDQKGMANDGKMTIAIPTMVPPIPELDTSGPRDQGNEIDVFVDDDVDIEVDVARAIYSNDGRFDEPANDQPDAPVIPEPTAASEPVVAAADAGAEEVETGPIVAEESNTEVTIQPVEEAQAPIQMDDTLNNPPESNAPIEEYTEDMFLSEDASSQAESASQSPDIDLFIDDSDAVDAAATEVETDWPEAIVEDAAPVEEAPAAEVLSDAPWNAEPELVGVAADTGRETEAVAEADEPAANKTLIELVTDNEDPESNAAMEGASNLDEAESANSPNEERLEPREQKVEEEAELPVAKVTEQPEVVVEVVAGVDAESNTDPSDDDDDLTATIEAAIEAVNLASMEEAQFRAAQREAEQVEAAQVEAAAEPSADENDAVIAKEVTAVADEVDIDVKATTVEMVVESIEQAGPVAEAGAVETEKDLTDEPEAAAVTQPEVISAEVEVPAAPEIEISAQIADQAAELELTETLGGGAKDYADADDDIRVESPSTSTDGQEEGEAEVLNEERSNMQALIAEQAERIENLQDRNVLLRQEVEQRKADDAMRNEERGNLQALIKEQTEAITNLQQRNVQLRQELEQFRADESKRESERTFLQSHTSEQAETIAKLQQLNALLRQELEQRKADEAPLRDFLQRLLDRDEESSAYQEAMRAEIISLTRENS